MRVDAVEPVVAAAPGERTTLRIRIVNDGQSPATYRARVLGVDGQVPMEIDGGPLAPSATAEVDLDIAIPAAYAAGRHAVAVEVASDRPGEATVLAGLTLVVDSLDRVLLHVNPSTIRGRRRGRFRVELDNRADETVDLALHGEGHHLAVTLRPPRIVLGPGERAQARGVVKGPRRVFGEPDHHVVAVVAQGRSGPRQTTATFLQRPLFPRGARTFLAAFMVLALWASAVGASALWWTNRDDARDRAAPEQQEAQAAAEGTESGSAAEGGAAGGREGTAGAGGEDGAGADSGRGGGRPTSTLIGGTVLAGETGDDADVTVSLAPLDLGAVPPEGAVAVNPGESAPTKLWPARFGRYDPRGAASGRQTVSVETATTGEDGLWLFGDVPLRQTYEVHFAKEGFDSQSFVVTPTDDGEPVEMDVVLLPAKGALGGRVVGPGAPRGGVDLVVTDGTLRFTATTSTAPGSVGTWAIGGVSTPGTYTVTAAAKGLGTEVIQVSLDPGEQRTDLRIDMVAGVGSIGGHVTFAGAPLSKVTVEASNGEVTRTTSSLTEGDAGSYFFPKLPVPGDWTVTVSGDGYVTQTRRISLDGNAGGVDFDVVRTTASLTGLVVSDVRGRLPGAAITITRDKLSFRTASAVAPDTGSFAVGDLPAGSYLVSFSRFDHRAASQLVTLSAGEVKDLGEILLTFEDRPSIAETGRLVVRVLDSVGTELTGATVTVTDVGDGTVAGQASDPDLNQSTFAFDDVPIGTYEVRVSRELYRTATTRVSIGLGEEVVEFRLLKLGQVSGRLVDSLTGEQLDNYEITISRLNPDGSETPIQRRPVVDGAAPNEEGEILWESEASSLTTGTYKVAVSDTPPGYRVVNDQVLDATLPEGQPRTMLFVIRPDNEAPLRLADIEADPLPTLSGRVYVPGPRAERLDATCQLGPLCPIDSAMTVTLACADSDAGPVPAVLSDEIGDMGTAAFDTFRFSPSLLDEHGLLGACTLAVTSGGYVSASVPLRSALVPSDGNTASDQIVNIALVTVIDPIGGRVSWLDLGVAPGSQEVPVDGVQIATAEAVTGFTDEQGTDPAAVPRPIVSALSTQSVDGVWLLAGQVFGDATYVFSHPQFDEGATPALNVSIDTAGGRTVGPAPPTDGPLVAVDDATEGILVTLQDPDDAAISGAVGVITADLPPNCAALGVAATEPGAGGPTNLTSVVTGSSCTFGVDPATPGTWGFEFTPPPHHQFFGAAPAAVTRFVQPDSTDTVVSTTLVELARIDVQVLDNSVPPEPICTDTPGSLCEDGGGIRPVVTLTHTQLPSPPFPPGDPPSSSATQTVNAAGSTRFDDLPVNLVSPLGFPASYQLSVEMPGYDTTVPDARPTVAVVAGSKPAIVIILLPEFGTITGAVEGQVGAAREDLPLDGTFLSVTATREALLDGTPITGQTPIVALANPPGGNGFLLSGPPGFYRIDVSHPHFQPVPISEPPSADELTPPDPLAPPGTYKIENDTQNALDLPFVLEIEPGSMTLTVVADQVEPLDGVAVTVNDPEAVVAATGPGTYVVSNVTPGSVRLELRLRAGDPSEDTHFPVIASISVPRGSNPAARDITVGAVMPRIGGSITGEVVARNNQDDLFPLPQITLTRTYEPPDVTAGTTTVPNTATEAVVVPVPPPALVLGGGTEAGVVTFSFPGLAVGDHVLTAPDVPGYITPTIVNPITVGDVTATDIGRLAYVARAVDVVVAVTSTAGTQPPLVDAIVTLTPPGGGPTLLPTTEEPQGTFTFDDVTPDPLAYTLTVSAPLYATEISSLFVLPDADGTLESPVDLAPASATISGLARKQGTGGTVDLVAGEGTVRLFKLGAPPDTIGVEVPVVSPTIPGTRGLYSFAVTEAGNYRVQLELAGHATRSTTLTGVVLGQSYTAPDIVVLAYATAEITVTGDAANAADLTALVTEPSGSGLVAERVGNVFVFAALDPEVLYRFQVRATGFVSVDVPTSLPLDPAIGGLHVFTVQPQYLRTVTVTTEDNSGAQNNATVVARVPAGGGGQTFSCDGPTNVYNCIGVVRGAGDVVVSVAGYRTRTVAFADSPTATNIAVEVKPLVTVTGTVTDGTSPVAGLTVSATNGTTTLTDDTDSAGVYSIPGLNIGTWTVSALLPGTGADSDTVTVTDVSSTAETRNLALVPRDLAWVFTVTDTAGAVPGATVTLDGVTDTTDAAGQATITTAEDGALAWTVSSPTHITQNGTATPTVLAIPVALVARPTLTGTVSNATGVVVGASVYLCPADPAAASCSDATDLATVTSGAGGAYSFRPDQGSWEVRAVLAATSSADASVSVTGGVAIPNPVPPLILA